MQICISLKKQIYSRVIDSRNGLLKKFLKFVIDFRLFKMQFSYPKSISVYNQWEYFSCCHFTPPLYSVKNFCWLTAVGASRAAFTPSLNLSAWYAGIVTSSGFAPRLTRVSVSKGNIDTIFSFLKHISIGNLAIGNPTQRVQEPARNKKAILHNIRASRWVTELLPDITR